MAPSSGHLLVPKVLRIVKFGYYKAAALIKSKLPSSIPNTSLQPIRITAQTQPIHPIAYFKQSRSQTAARRWFSTSSSKAKPTPSGLRCDRSKFPSSTISRAIAQKGHTPFANTLRPNLTGGALPRSAGGYGIGGGARHFSHTTGAQAQVVQNVSAGIRAFCVNGGKARFDGVDKVTGEKRFRAVSATEDAVLERWESPMASPKGTSVEFKLSPTITALVPSFAQSQLDSKVEVTPPSSIDLLDDLATDFARALRDLALILRDLRLLSTFGDLPISLHHTPSGPILSVRFPGCDADLAARLCDEVGVKRGVIIEDEAWADDGEGEKDVEMALLFPFAPSRSLSATSEDAGRYYFDDSPFQQENLEWRNMLSPATRHSSVYDDHSFEAVAATLRSPVLHHPDSPSGYESVGGSDFAPADPYYPSASPARESSHQSYEGVEGIYKFLQVCEDVRR